MYYKFKKILVTCDTNSSFLTVSKLLKVNKLVKISIKIIFAHVATEFENIEQKIN